MALKVGIHTPPTTITSTAMDCSPNEGTKTVAVALNALPSAQVAAQSRTPTTPNSASTSSPFAFQRASTPKFPLVSTLIKLSATSCAHPSPLRQEDLAAVKILESVKSSQSSSAQSSSNARAAEASAMEIAPASSSASASASAASSSDADAVQSSRAFQMQRLCISERGRDQRFIDNQLSSLRDLLYLHKIKEINLAQLDEGLKRVAEELGNYRYLESTLVRGKLAHATVSTVLGSLFAKDSQSYFDRIKKEAQPNVLEVLEFSKKASDIARLKISVKMIEFARELNDIISEILIFRDYPAPDEWYRMLRF